MKRSTEDIEFANLLKERTPKVEQNPWFTRKVINRLPEKGNSQPVWIYTIALCAAVVVLVAAWAFYLSNVNLYLITVRDIVIFLSMASVTAFSIIAGIVSFISHDF